MSREQRLLNIDEIDPKDKDLIDQQLQIRRDLLKRMVGQLYRSIVADQIIILNRMHRTGERESE